MSFESADAIIRAREVDSLPNEQVALLGILPHPLSDTLLAHFQEFARATTMQPSGWLITIRSNSGSPAITAILDLKATLGIRMSIQRRRDSW
jgi:hypothetical protein